MERSGVERSGIRIIRIKIKEKCDIIATHKYNISARVPRSTDVILAHFFERMKNKKCAQIPSVLLGILVDMVYLCVVCLFCAASPRQRCELLPSQWWQVVVFGLWQTISETAIKFIKVKIIH